MEFGAFLDFVAILAPQQQKKRKPKDSILPRWGVKKQQSLFSPPKESFGKSKGVWVDFVFKVGGKIGWVDFWVQSRSQNRFVTILNPYMGGGEATDTFSPLDRCSNRCSNRRSNRCSNRRSNPRSNRRSNRRLTHVRVYAHLFDIFGNFKNF